ncbi:hypothetical protein IW261DRAFT_1372396 [Armillaria novae-zelandiae]|uniref:Heterokaryon incompatibility domain-containing protein n=1 Tax=Armillaria novae-zelandiae TaxID=153914 RepID=A0AA39NRW3_9AGAR|nr:hypothetical protein IW261DRAFT_1372396 [Armillaria novae-zelandiae]
MSQKFKHLPEVTLSASNIVGGAESSIPVLKQRSYTGTVFPSAIANISCAALGVDGTLEMLNAPVRSLDSHLYHACESFVAKNYDLGTAYAHLRPHPYNFVIESDVEKTDQSDRKRQQDFIKQGKIDVDAPPRRVWDLHANRVVPYGVANELPLPISHAWVADQDLKREMTPINGYQWPVPIPKDANLDLIRIEMLNLGAEYIWLDVLCLRQEGEGEDPRGNPGQWEWDRREALRKEEWKVDVPAIGWLYAWTNRVVCYLSGLGLPLSFKTANDFENDRCWFNRAWTLQETPRNPLIAGKTHDDGIIDERYMTEEMQRRCNEQLESLGQMMQGEPSLFKVLSQVQKQKSTKLVDKVTALVYLFHSQRIPIYDSGQSEEDAWTELMRVMSGWFRAEFFFLYPKPGSGIRFWRPSWHQVMEEILPEAPQTFRNLPDVRWREEDGDSYFGPRIDACRVRGLADVSDNPRHGGLDVESRSGVECSFKIAADHSCAIDDGEYTLIGALQPTSFKIRPVIFWVVGKMEEREGKFRKISVFRMASPWEAHRLKILDIYKNRKTFLL